VIAGVLLALLTSVSWAFGNVFVQKSGRALGTARATLWALVVGAVCAGGLSLLLGEPRAVGAADLGWTALAGVAGLLAYACLFAAFERAPLSLAVPLVSSWSLIAGVIAFTVLGERPRPVPLLGAVVVFVGVVLVSLAAGGQVASSEGPRRRGALLVPLGAAVGFGVMIPALARVGQAWGALGGTAVVYALVVALGLPLVLAGGRSLRPPHRADWGLVLATGCSETVGFVCVSLARRYAPMTLVTPVSSLAATLTVLYAWVVLRERPPRLAAAGAALACLGVVILSL
jgi:drug/metabolite transporter (DMT)-like permease